MAWRNNVRKGAGRLLTCGSWLLASLPGWAQEAQKEFVPAESIPRQELASAPLLYGAYAFVWAALLVYVFILWRKIGRVERELADVNRKLSKK